MWISGVKHGVATLGIEDGSLTEEIGKAFGVQASVIRYQQQNALSMPNPKSPPGPSESLRAGKNTPHDPSLTFNFLKCSHFCLEFGGISLKVTSFWRYGGAQCRYWGTASQEGFLRAQVM